MQLLYMGMLTQTLAAMVLALGAEQLAPSRGKKGEGGWKSLTRLGNKQPHIWKYHHWSKGRQK